jgi:nicotinate-nucleotide adenylyltransferase
MTKLAIRGNGGFEVSDIETQRGGISYTIDTVNSLVEIYPKATVSLIIGADNLLEFQTWKSPDEILSKVQLVAMTRPGFTIQPQAAKFSKLVSFVHVPYVGVSGTDVRLRIKMGRTIRYLVPQPVEEYIMSRRLYRETD